MRKSTVKQLNDKEITIKEMRVRDILNMFQNPDKDFTSMISFINKGNIIVEKCIVGITFEELQDLAPSELKELYEAFKEVNETFFDLLGSLGVMDILGNLKSQFTQDLMKVSANASNTGTGKTLGIMDMTSSTQPSE